jgi:hypothetical protein
MNISAIKAYNEPINASVSNGISKDSSLTKLSSDSSDTKLGTDNSSYGNSVLTKNERSFFMKLFPENSAQIEQHELFNRNGKVTKTSFSKGTILDWTV